MTKRHLIPVLLLAWLPAVAQEPAAPKTESIKGVVRKNLAPVSDAVLQVKLPRPVERTLKNGLKVLIMENHRVPTIEVELLIPASTVSDPAGLAGVADATADLLRQGGTATRSSRQIADELSAMGARLYVGASWGARTTRLSGGALSEYFDRWLAIASDVLLNATYPQDEFEKWRKRQLAALLQQRANPSFLGNERLYAVLYGGDPRALTSATRESLEKMTREDLLAFRKRFYVPGQSLLGITGDITPDQAVAKLEKALAGWQAASVAEPALGAKPPIAEKKIYLVNRPDSVQTLLILGNHAIDRLSPDYIPCLVLNQVLGAGPASRLFVNIREEKGFTYGVYSRFTAQKFLDQFSASSSVRTEVTGAALDEFLKEFRKVREEPVPQEELTNAKHAMVGRFALSLENQSGILDQMMSLREYGLPADYWDTYPAKVMAVTAADVQRVAQKYIPLDNLQIVAVGDAGKIRDVLKKYGPVEEYTTEGKKVQ